MNTLAPGTTASLRRRRAMTAIGVVLASSLRSPMSFNSTMTRPVFSAPPPVKARHVHYGRVSPNDFVVFGNFPQHRGKGNVLFSDDGAIQAAGILLREKSLGHNVYRNTFRQIAVMVMASMRGW